MVLFPPLPPPNPAVLEDTLHDKDILRADLKEEINSLKLQNKEQQEEILQLKSKVAETFSEKEKISTDIEHVEKKDTPGINSNVNHKTRDEKDVDKSPETIEHYSFVYGFNFKCEGGKCDFSSKTKKSLISHITLEHFYNFKSKKYECKTCEKLDGVGPVDNRPSID